MFANIYNLMLIYIWNISMAILSICPYQKYESAFIEKCIIFRVTPSEVIVVRLV